MIEKYPAITFLLVDHLSLEIRKEFFDHFWIKAENGFVGGQRKLNLRHPHDRTKDVLSCSAASNVSQSKDWAGACSSYIDNHGSLQPGRLLMHEDGHPSLPND